MSRPRLLDLFCGAGGSAVGYHRAGFDVVGVDIEPQKNYPFEVVQDDALLVLQMWERHDRAWGPFDAIHASPPCQAYSTTASLHDSTHPDLYVKTRELLEATGLPWVIENVVGAPYRSGIILCGSMFGLRVRRHRNFESSVVMMRPECRHDLSPDPIDVTGTGGASDIERTGNGGIHRKPRNLLDAQDAMGIDWMTRRELSQAIPPVYTEFIGQQLLQHLSVSEAP